MQTETAPYGSWTSPITAHGIARGSVTLVEPSLVNGMLWWVEERPMEGGREVVVRANLDGSERQDVFRQSFSAVSRVHEYGGGAYAVLPGGVVVFSNDADGRVYRVDPETDPVAISPEPSQPRALRYADFAATPDGTRVYCVRESHEGGREPVNEIVALPADGSGDVEVIASGHDFYAAPRVSPDGRVLAWQSWDHPRMPWDGNELWRGRLDGGSAELVAGGPRESIFGPQWSPAGLLDWASDRTGWGELYREREPLYPAEVEFGMAQWAFGEDGYTFLDDGRIACMWTSRSFSHLGVRTRSRLRWRNY